jgi:AcrR family transcriptional regulator
MTRDKIFMAASKLLSQEGIAGLSIRKIAKAAGLSPMGLYRHFADKDALINALMAQGFVAWEARVARIDSPDPVQWLHDFIEAFLTFSLEEPHLFDAAFLLPATEARQFPDDFAAQRSPSVALAMTRIDQAKAMGKLGGGTALNIALTMWALGQGLVSLYRAGRFSDEAHFKEMYRQTVRDYLTSLETRDMARTP